MRPTADRVREALFARLPELENGADWKVLDLYAGIGTLGIEALSRGAGRAVFVERNRAALAVLRRNLGALELADRTRVVAADVLVATRRLGKQGERFDLVLADPPYADSEPAEPLGALAREGLLAPNAVVVVERSRRHPLPEIAGLVLLDSRSYGDTVIERLGPAPAADPIEEQGESKS